MEGTKHGWHVVFTRTQVGRESTGKVACCLSFTRTQVGQIWIRLYSNGQRLAQIVLNSDYTVASMPKPNNDGGLKVLRYFPHNWK